MALHSALITGAATGLGADLARGFLQAGYSLTLLDIQAEALERTVQALSAPPGRVSHHVLDVRDAQQQEAAMQRHVATYGRLDVAVLNAGIAETGNLFDAGNSDWQRTLDVDLTAVISGTRAAAILMAQQPAGGVIVCIASAGGIYPMPAAPVYAAAKAGVVQLVRSAGRPLSKRGVRLLAVCPEFVDTPLVRSVADPAKRRQLMGRGEVQLLQPPAVTHLVMRLLAEPEPHPGGTVVLLRQDGRVESPLPQPAEQPRSRGPATPTVTPGQREALAAWAVAGVGATFKKYQVTRLGVKFREVTRVVEVVVPAPGKGQVLVRRVFAGVNASDVNYTAGRYHTSVKEAAASLPFDCGFESVGVVMRVGEGVTGLQPGDVVASMTYGSFSELGLMPAAQALQVPRLDARVVALLTSGLTASIAFEVCAKLAPGQKVLVTAAAGGTGQFAVQLARLAGCHVIATAGGPDKAALVRRLGAHRVVDYKRENLKAVLKAEYPQGVDVVYESVGGDMFNTCVSALAQGGSLIIIGMMSQYAEGWPAGSYPGLAEKLLWKSASLHGFFLLRHARLWRRHLDRLVGLVETGQLHVALDAPRHVGMAAVPDAVERLQSGASMGKVLVQIPAHLPQQAVPAGAAAAGSGAPPSRL